MDLGESPISPPLSPFIYRRPLDSRTERELRNACAEIVKENDEPEQKLNFQPLNATKAIAPKEVAATESKPPFHHPIRNSSKPDTRSSNDSYNIPAGQDVSQTNARWHREPSHDSYNTRESQPFSTRKDLVSTRTTNTMNPLLMCPPERPKTAPMDSSMSDMSSVTPKTASTDQQFNYASTTFTSAELTPSHIISKRASQLGLDNDAYRAAQLQADTEAAVWMRQELEKRRQYAQMTQAPQPPPSRSSARGWINEVREFVRPGSSSGTRPGSSAGGPSTGTSQSRPSLSRDRQGSGSFRSSSAHGWRSWSGLRRKSSKSSFSDFNGDENSRGLSEQDDGLNLNKGLPSLHSLDTWKDPQPQSKTSGGQHISMLIKGGKNKNKASKPPTVPQSSIPLAVRVDRQMHIAEPARSASKSAPPIQAFDRPLYTESPASPSNRTMPIAKSQVRRISAAPEDRRIPAVRAHHSKTSSTDSCFSPASSSSVGAHQSVDPKKGAQRLTKQESNVDLNKVSERLETHQRMQRMKSYTKSASSLSHQRHLSDSTSQTRSTTEDERGPNFSRKISTERPINTRLPNKAEITALPVMPQKNKPSSRLRRVLSKLEITNKSNRQPKSWMDTFEANGVKTGVLEARGTSAVPVVRY